MKLLDIISESATPASVTAGPGETVYSIGRKYSVDPLTLFKLNNFNKDTRLEVGQSVILPTINKIPATPASYTKPTAKSKPAKTSVALEPAGLGATIEQAAKSKGIEGVHLACFMAQCKVETAGFKSLVEWATGDKYEGRKDLGNIYPGDGRKFKGRGFIHLTGRGDYTKCNEKYNWTNTPKDIVKHPTLVETNIDIAITTSLWYWDTYIRPNYKATSIVAVSTRVNGTNPNGLTARIDAFKNYCAKLGIKIKGIVAPVHKATKHHAELDPGMEPDAVQMAANDDEDTIQTDLAEDQTEQFCPECGGSLAEEGRASRALCTSGRPDSALGASQLASCKSQGLRARDGEKSHLITHGARKVRVTVGGKKIKGKKYGGPLPDYGTRKAQLGEALEIPVSSYDTEPIKQLQQVLINLIYTNVKVTGILDKPTKDALKDFQSYYLLTPNGLPQYETIKTLNDLIKKNPKLQPGAVTKPPVIPYKPPTQDTTTSKPKPNVDTTTTQSPNTNVPPWLPKDSKDKSPWNMNNEAGKTKIVMYLFAHMSVNHVKGIVANIASESMFEPGMYVEHDIAVPSEIQQLKKTNYAEYIKQLRAWHQSPQYLSAGCSGGLCQWHKERYTAMVKACGGMDKWQSNWQGQLDYLLSEGLTKAYLKRKQATPEEATKDWMLNWEKPSDVTDIAQKGRSDWIDKIFYTPKKKE
jgi:putative chitinase